MPRGYRHCVRCQPTTRRRTRRARTHRVPFSKRVHGTYAYARSRVAIFPRSILGISPSQATMALRIVQPIQTCKFPTTPIAFDVFGIHEYITLVRTIDG